MQVGTWVKHAAAGLAVLAATLLPAGAARAEDLRVGIDQAVPIRLAGPAEGVAVGNPAIAGVSVQNDQLLFVTGRAYGATNLVVVGSGGRLLFAGRVMVTAQEGDGTVMVTRGAEGTSRLSCTPSCRPSPDIGDSPTTFTSATSQIGAHASTASGN